MVSRGELQLTSFTVDLISILVSIGQALSGSDERCPEAALASKGNKAAHLQRSHVHCKAFTEVRIDIVYKIIKKISDARFLLPVA